MPNSLPYSFSESVPVEQPSLNHPASAHPGHLLSLEIAAVIVFLIYRHQAKANQKTRSGIGSVGRRKDAELEAKLLNLCGDYPTALRLLQNCRLRHPGQSRTWYFEKAIWDLERDRH